MNNLILWLEKLWFPLLDLHQYKIKYLKIIIYDNNLHFKLNLELCFGIFVLLLFLTLIKKINIKGTIFTNK